MSEQRDFLRRLVDLLDKAGVPYMVAGSLGSSLHGRPRATNDIDLVISPAESQFQHFLDSWDRITTSARMLHGRR